MRKADESKPKRQRKTYHDGANEMRSSMLAKLRKDFRNTEAAATKRYIATLITFVLEHNERTDSRKGGLGRR